MMFLINPSLSYEVMMSHYDRKLKYHYDDDEKAENISHYGHIKQIICTINERFEPLLTEIQMN